MIPTKINIGTGIEDDEKGSGEVIRLYDDHALVRWRDSGELEEIPLSAILINTD